MSSPSDNGATGSGRPRFSKSDTRYWLERVSHVTQGRWTSATFSVRFSAHGEQRLVTLAAKTKKEAATEAKQLWIAVVANGWESAGHLSRKRAPDAPKQEKGSMAVATVGNLIEIARVNLVDVRPRSLMEYIRALRTIVSQSFEISKSGPGGVKRWRETIDSQNIRHLTQQKIQAWIVARIGSDQDQSPASKRTIRTVLRNAQSLYRKSVLEELKRRYGVSLVSPFSELTRPKAPTVRHRSKFILDDLIKHADLTLNHVNTPDFEKWKILILIVTAGLRRSELDRLCWRDIDLNQNCVNVVEDRGMAKTTSSVGSVALARPVVEHIRAWPKGSPEDFVIPAGKDPRIPQYRAGKHFADLVTWLRAYEVEGQKPFAEDRVQKPLHELRKEAGSKVYTKDGLHGAKVFLRHDNIETTSRHYLDSNAKYNVSLGGIFSESEPTTNLPPRYSQPPNPEVAHVIEDDQEPFDYQAAIKAARKTA